MASKTLGYILAGVGLLGTALLFEPVKSIIKLSTILPAKWSPTDTTLTIISIGAIVAGIILIKISSGSSGFSLGKKVSEVPIYNGKQVVGYRRVKQ